VSRHADSVLGFDQGDEVEVSLCPRVSFRGFDLSDGVEVSLCPSGNLRGFGLLDQFGVSFWEMVGRPLLG